MKTIIATTTLVALFGLERARAAGGRLPENAHCWPAGGNMPTRDAACAGNMVCARRGFNGRQWGGSRQHLCTKPPKYTFTLVGTTGEEQVMIGGEKFNLSKEEVEFGSESRVELVEFIDGGLSTDKQDKNVYVDNSKWVRANVRAASGKVLGYWNGSWKCAKPLDEQNERCNYVRLGMLMWTGGYLLEFDREDDMIPMNNFSCKASSEYSSAFTCKNAIDGNLKSDWATKGQGTGASYTLNLGAIFTIETLTLQHRSSGSAKEQERFKDIRLTFDDGSQKTATLSNSPDFQDIVLASATTTQNIKITVLSVHNPRGHNNHGLSEIIVFGTKTVPFTKCPAGFVTKTNMDYHGNDIACGKGLSMQEAQRQCLDNDECLGFSVLTKFNVPIMRKGGKLYQPWCLKKGLTSPRLRHDHSFCVREYPCRKNIDIGRHFKVEKKSVNGKCTGKIVVKAGQPVAFSANWLNQEAGCKGCIEQLYFGIKGTPMKCLWSKNPRADERGVYQKTYTFDTPGTYEIHAATTWQMRCNNNIKRGVRLVTVEVK